MDTPKAFEIEVNGKLLDYRVGQAVDLNAVKIFFSKTYEVKRIWNGGRHVLGIISRDGKDYFLKLATSEGISALSGNECRWNAAYARAVPRDASDFWVHQNIEEGWYSDTLYYFITDLFTGHQLAELPPAEPGTSQITARMGDIIRFSEIVQEVPVGVPDAAADYREVFMAKVRSWYAAIPERTASHYEVHSLLEIVERGVGGLSRRPRHGDFTPWHIMKLDNGKLGLIDGEHFLPNGVAYYDIGYFIQRVFAVLEAPDTAKALYNELLVRGYDAGQLRVILASRAIGGYLDASLSDSPSYDSARFFHEWVYGSL